MNWFNLQDLENRLSDNNVSDKESFYYLMANLILFGLGSYGATDSYNNDAFLIAEGVLMLLVTVVGLNMTFKANQKGDGKDYLKRFLSLYFVIGIRLFVFIILLTIPVGLLVYFIFGKISGQLVKDLLYISLITVIGVIFYYFMIRSFKKVSNYIPQ